MNATITNAVSDCLLAVFLLYCALKCIHRYFQGDKRYTLFIALFFSSVFLVTALAAWAHYDYKASYVNQIWLGITSGIIFLNYCLAYAINIPDKVRVLVVLLSLILAACFQYTGHFLFIALSIIFIYSLAAFYSVKNTRTGFILIVLSNIVWIVLREGAQLILDQKLPAKWRYDNDIYHLLLIYATYRVYRSIGQNDWRYPNQ